MVLPQPQLEHDVGNPADPPLRVGNKCALSDGPRAADRISTRIRFEGRVALGPVRSWPLAEQSSLFSEPG